MQTYLLLFVAMAAIFYFLILRPQQRTKRAKAELMSALTEGSEILTVGGIYGTVIELRDEDMDLEIAEGVVMRIDRRALATVIPVATDEDDEDEDDDLDDDASVDEDYDDDSDVDETPAAGDRPA
ncbi:MAG: preprotein translocase subunit YajC [Actinobacteria bacterium]|nr:preprotein translocase subunit YajC [Actinomycetota bacterium]